VRPYFIALIKGFLKMNHKIKGSIDFNSEKRKKFIRSLKQFIKDGDCIEIRCSECIFSRGYAEDEEHCTDNSMFTSKDIKNVGKANSNEMVNRAKEILKEIQANEH
jgi:hypothetical protein